MAGEARPHPHRILPPSPDRQGLRRGIRFGVGYRDYEDEPSKQNARKHNALKKILAENSKPGRRSVRHASGLS